MHNSFKKYKFYTVIVIIQLLSCSREKSFQYQIQNNSYYKLEEVIVDDKNLKTISIDPYSSSQILVVNWKRPIFSVAESFLNLYVKTYSDSLGQYVTTSNSGLISLDDDLKEGKINIIELKFLSNQPCCVFQHSIK